MKAFKLVGLLALLAHPAAAQGKKASVDEPTTVISCKRASLDIWILESGSEQPIQGKLAGMSQETIYYCFRGAPQAYQLTQNSVVYFKQPQSTKIRVSQALERSAPIRQQLSHDTLSGWVKVQFWLYKTGERSLPRPMDSKNFQLNDLAVEAAKKLPLAPIYKDGNQVDELIEVEFTFVAKNVPAKPSESSAEIPEPLYPIKSQLVPIDKPAALTWKPVAGVVSYVIKVEYLGLDGQWKREWTERVQAFLLPYMGQVRPRWTVEAELKNGARVESWWAQFEYEKK
jgi:hypothetical protein